LLLFIEIVGKMLYYIVESERERDSATNVEKISLFLSKMSTHGKFPFSLCISPFKKVKK